MRLLNVLSVLFALGALAAGYFAYDEWEQAEAIGAVNAGLRAELGTLDQETRQISSEQEIRPAKDAAAALSDFFTTAISAGEVLGAGVRVETRAGPVTEAQFSEFKYGLKVAQASVRAAATIEAAPALFAMLDDEISELPVAVRAIQVTVTRATATIKMDVDVFGR